MRIELTLFILLCAKLSCDALLEKLLDPLNVSGAILKGISFNNKYDGGGNPGDGQYSSVYKSSSSGSYSYGGSIGGGANGFEGPPQTYGYRTPTQGHVEISQLTNNGGFIQDYGYGGTSHTNGFRGQLQETSQGNYQQSNRFGEGGVYHSGVPQKGNLGLTFNINLGSLFGLGHSKHGHYHGHKQHHNQGNVNGDFYSENISEGNLNGHGQIQNHNEGYDRPVPIGYQNHGSQQFNQYEGYNRPEQNGQQNEQILHETTHVIQQQHFNDYNPIENTNPGDKYNDNVAQYPIQNDKNYTPIESDGQNRDKNVNIEPTVYTPTEIVYISSTESTKTPYENEKNSKVTTSNRKTTIRPETDQPLLVPLNPNEYKYEGDKIQIASPKRNAEENSQKQEINTEDEDFDIDVRFNDDE